MNRRGFIALFGSALTALAAGIGLRRPEVSGVPVGAAPDSFRGSAGDAIRYARAHPDENPYWKCYSQSIKFDADGAEFVQFVEDQVNASMKAIADAIADDIWSNTTRVI